MKAIFWLFCFASALWASPIYPGKLEIFEDRSGLFPTIGTNFSYSGGPGVSVTGSSCCSAGSLYSGIVAGPNSIRISLTGFAEGSGVVNGTAIFPITFVQRTAALEARFTIPSGAVDPVVTVPASAFDQLTACTADYATCVNSAMPPRPAFSTSFAGPGNATLRFVGPGTGTSPGYRLVNAMFTSESPTSSVPEPASAFMAALGIAFLINRSRIRFPR